MEINPSVPSICMAFLDLYKFFEETLMQWCEVVGEVFISNLVKHTGQTFLQCPYHVQYFG
jgi:hypothetical protein